MVADSKWVSSVGSGGYTGSDVDNRLFSARAHPVLQQETFRLKDLSIYGKTKLVLGSSLLLLHRFVDHEGVTVKPTLLVGLAVNTFEFKA